MYFRKPSEGDGEQWLQEAYGPGYKVVGVKSREVLLNAGNIHCITQQWVAGS
jgi:agmatine deiminase